MKMLIVLKFAPRRPLAAAIVLALCLLTTALGCKPPARKKAATSEATAAANSAPATPNTVGPGTGKLTRIVRGAVLEAYSENGELDENEIVAPWLMTYTKPLDPRIKTDEDKALLATNVAKLNHGGLPNVRVLSTEPITIDGVNGYEFVVNADSKEAQTTLAIYMAVLFPDDNYTLIRGSADKSVADEWIPEFRAMAHGWKKSP
jgi:hypothetical protein